MNEHVQIAINSRKQYKFLCCNQFTRQSYHFINLQEHV